MNIESFKINFLENLNGRNNYDLFGLDMNEDLHWGKLFIHLFGECYSRYSLCRRVDRKELIRSLVKRYSLSQSQILRIDRAREENAYEAAHEYSEVLLILKRGFMFGIFNNRIELLYASDISKAERNEVIKLVEQFKIDQKIVRKFHMIQRSGGYFELTDFDIKPFNVDIGTHYNDDFQ